MCKNGKAKHAQSVVAQQTTSSEFCSTIFHLSGFGGIVREPKSPRRPSYVGQFEIESVVPNGKACKLKIVGYEHCSMDLCCREGAVG